MRAFAAGKSFLSIRLATSAAMVRNGIKSPSSEAALALDALDGLLAALPVSAGLEHPLKASKSAAVAAMVMQRVKN